MDERASVHCLVSGRVQGVGFRWHTRAKASELGLQGWCANLDDGRVEVVAQGRSHELDEFVAWLGRGPSHARVTDVRVDHGGEESALAPDYSRVAF